MVLLLSVFIGIALDFAGARPADTPVKYYATKYDHIDVEAILNNRRLVNYYSACLLGKGACPPEGVELKRILPEALLSNCGRCTEKQATVALRAIRRLKKEYPKIWTQLSEKWDPDDVYVNKFESTFWLRNSANKPTVPPPIIVDRFGEDNDAGNFSPALTTSHQGVVTSTNSNPPSSTTSTKITTDYPYPEIELTSFVSTTKTTTKPSSSSKPTSSSTSPPKITESPITTQFIPNLIPMNTFFTNPPITVRPFINLNIGGNLGATVSEIVKGLGALGMRFMETGSDIAELVIKSFARPFPA